MIKNSNGNISFLICTVFLFRILFFNLIIPSQSNFQHDNASVKSHFLKVMKRRSRLAEDAYVQHLRYSSEICEGKDSKDKSEVPPKHFFLIQVFYSFISTEIVTRLNPVALFNQDNTFNSSPRYIALQVFRT